MEIFKDDCLEMNKNLSCFNWKKRNKLLISLKYLHSIIVVWKEVKSQSTKARIPIPLKHEVVLQWNGPWLAYFPEQSSWFSEKAVLPTQGTGQQDMVSKLLCEHLQQWNKGTGMHETTTQNRITKGDVLPQRATKIKHGRTRHIQKIFPTVPTPYNQR